ncbi:hypothetical protein D3C72_1700180 [compost metagenome]
MYSLLLKMEQSSYSITKVKLPKLLKAFRKSKTENLSIMTTQITSFKIRFQHLGDNYLKLYFPMEPKYG